MGCLARWENITAIHAQIEALHDEWLKQAFRVVRGAQALSRDIFPMRCGAREEGKEM